MCKVKKKKKRQSIENMCKLEKVENVVGDISPVKVCKKNGSQKSCWRKSTAVQRMKRQCRKAERMGWKTKLEIHYSIYKDSLHAFNVELATARQTFFSNLINSNLNNTKTVKQQ